MYSKACEDSQNFENIMYPSPGQLYRTCSALPHLVKFISRCQLIFKTHCVYSKRHEYFCTVFICVWEEVTKESVENGLEIAKTHFSAHVFELQNYEMLFMLPFNTFK